jgi:Xaa-Pro aminopeptidase
MAEKGVDAVLLSVGPDMPWLIGYEAMALERLTMLVVPRDAEARLVIPAFEIARVQKKPEFEIAGWGETEDPFNLVIEILGGATGGHKLAIGDHTWSRFLVGLGDRMPNAQWSTAGSVVGPLRAVKETAEIAALQRAADGVDRVALALQSGEIPLIGRTEAEVSAELGLRVLAEGHRKVNFAIVASGPNASSPHHHASDRVIQANEVVLCDFGGTTAEADGGPGYCSDITRCVYTGQPPAEFAESYQVLFDAQAQGVAAATVGRPAGEVDRVSRQVMDKGGLGEWFLHRLGHGIGVEAHEDPYLVEGNVAPLEAGNVFSIEPGFYIDGKWGARLEDIVVSTADGPRPLNKADHNLAIVEG